MEVFHVHSLTSTSTPGGVTHYTLKECTECGDFVAEEPTAANKQDLKQDYDACKQLTATYAIQGIELDESYRKARAVINEYQSTFFHI